MVAEVVAAYIEQYQLLPREGVVVVAVSGGADSLCLLHLLHQLCGHDKHYPGVRLHVAHLNHQLRGAVGAEDARVVAELAAAWGLPCTIGSVDVPTLAREEQRSLEDAARTARYRFLREVARGLQELTQGAGEVPIAVAHHSDDQVETLLLHWLRGGGISSMIGLQPRQQDIIRPLLSITHADIMAYCHEYKLIPLEDASNTDTRFLRNRIRHELLPLLESMNPGIRATLLRTAEVMRVDANWIEQQVAQNWPVVVTAKSEKQVRLCAQALLALPLSLQRHLLRWVTSQLMGGQSPLELRHYKLIKQLVQRGAAAEGRTLHLPQHLHVRYEADEVVFEHLSVGTDLSRPDLSRPGPEVQIGSRDAINRSLRAEEVILPIPGCVEVPGTLWIAQAETLPEPLEQEVQEALNCEDWAKVWQILPFTRYAVYIDRDTVGRALKIRTRRPGDRIQSLGMQYEKKVQDILVDKHVARVERERIPLFFAADHCVWLAGITIDHRVRLTKTTQQVVRLSIIPST